MVYVSFLLIFARTPKILMDLLMNHMECELYFLRSTKGKLLNIRKNFSSLNVEGGFFFKVDWIHVLRMATISLSFSDGAGSLWKRVNTNSLMSVDNSLNECI